MYRKLSLMIFSFFVVTGFIVYKATACSLAVLKSKEKSIIARNMDWISPDGYVVKNYPGVERRAKLILINPYKWKSKYGSITINLEQDTHIPGIGKQNVAGCGLNEKGLFAGELWVVGPPKVNYPVDYGKSWLATAEVVQTILDTCANVDEAISRFKEFSLEGFTFLRWAGVALDLHWFVSDSSGKTAILEYPDAKWSEHNPPIYSAMTNHYYERSNEELKKYKGFGGNNDIPDEVPFDKKTSLMRFVLTCDSVVDIQTTGNVTLDSGFELLKRVSAQDSPVLEGGSEKITTHWSVVYDLKERTITWISSKNAGRRWIDLDGIDFPVRNNRDDKRISVQSSDVGDITNKFQN
ncbi:MAG: linear amide C-N hydrolase [Desulfobacterales bacterium]|nr:linear amide C-N hydrolase [Desulfobacterales bacterium]